MIEDPQRGRRLDVAHAFNGRIGDLANQTVGVVRVFRLTAAEAVVGMAVLFKSAIHDGYISVTQSSAVFIPRSVIINVAFPKALVYFPV